MNVTNGFATLIACTSLVLCACALDGDTSNSGNGAESGNGRAEPVAEGGVNRLIGDSGVVTETSASSSSSESEEEPPAKACAAHSARCGGEDSACVPLNSKANCGACGNACLGNWLCGGSECVCGVGANSCAGATTCEPDSVSACGESCAVCADSKNGHGVAACTGGVCKVVCENGYGSDGKGGCAPLPAWLTTPGSSTLVTLSVKCTNVKDIRFHPMCGRSPCIERETLETCTGTLTTTAATANQTDIALKIDSASCKKSATISTCVEAPIKNSSASCSFGPETTNVCPSAAGVFTDPSHVIVPFDESELNGAYQAIYPQELSSPFRSGTKLTTPGYPRPTLVSSGVGACLESLTSPAFNRSQDFNLMRTVGGLAVGPLGTVYNTGVAGTGGYDGVEGMCTATISIP